MKLIRFAIHDPAGFRSLPQGFEINFLGELDYDRATEFNPYVLAGGNGSGKSNVLEALAEIFYHLDCRYLDNLPDYFEKSEPEEDEDQDEEVGKRIDEDYDPYQDAEDALLRYNPKGYDSNKCRIDAYELEYFIFPDAEIFGESDSKRRARVLITKAIEKAPEIVWVDRVQENESLPILTRDQCRALLPEYVVGYASGNNETLSTPFFKSRLLQYDAYVNNLINEAFVDPRPETSLVYLDEAYSQAILLTNLLMWGDAETGKHGEQLVPFVDTIRLERIDTFRLEIRLDTISKEWLRHLSESGQFLEMEETGEEPRLIEGLDLDELEGSPQIRSYLNKLKLCATCFRVRHEEAGPISGLSSLENSDKRRSYLDLDYKVDSATRKAFRFHFAEPVNLFELLHLLLVLNHHELDRLTKRHIYNATGKDSLYLAQRFGQLPNEDDRILRIRNFNVRKRGVTESIDTRALSDGEHQFLHTLGLSLLYKDKRTLFLFDEPETHFNPNWKAKFITAIRSCFKQEEQDAENTMREMLITTHSPLVISDCEREYVRVFRRAEDSQEVYVSRPDQETLGASISKIGIDLFDMPETIGDYALSKLEVHIAELEQLNDRAALTDLFKRVSRDYGESVERELLRHRIIQKIESL
jgi:restriction system-associated AAA family ATPase